MTTPTTGLDGLRERAGELLPCPFCGAQPVVWNDGEDWIAACVGVATCHAEPGCVLNKTREEAIRKWNTRAPRAPAAPQGAEGWVLVPKELTAENGAKAALIGEFHEPHYIHDAAGLEHDDRVHVSWTTIKAIHKRVVELFAASPAPAQDAATGGELKPCPLCGQHMVLRDDCSHTPWNWYAHPDNGCLLGNVSFNGAPANVTAWNTRTPSPDAREGLVERRIHPNDPYIRRADIPGFPIAGSAEESAWDARKLAEKLWRDLLEKDDRTSPAEYPDMALITFDEFKAALLAALPAVPEVLG